MTEHEEYAALATRGADIQQLLVNQARRPFVLEVTGTPKAGKTSTIAMIEAFFKACNWRVFLLRERAGECPLPMKGHFFFNTWTTATMLAQVLEVVDRDIDLVILDRGFFDALIWLELQRARRQVTSEEADVFVNFVLLDRWRSLVDLTVVMTVEPEIAMEREQHDRLIRRRGSVMKEPVLAEFNNALTKARDAYGDRFHLLDKTSTAERKAVAAALIQDILDVVEPWADPEIAVVPGDLVRELFAADHALSWPTDAWVRLAASAESVKRSKAEADEQLVQLVACGVPIGPGGVFVFDRTRDKKRLGEYGAYSVWNGQHVDVSPVGRSVDLDLVRKNLISRVHTKLHLNFDPDPQPLGIVWVDDDQRPRSKQHLGVFFAVRIDDENVAQSLEDKEFRTRGRGHPATSQFSTIEALADRSLELEPWSREVVDNGWLKAAEPES